MFEYAKRIFLRGHLKTIQPDFHEPKNTVFGSFNILVKLILPLL